MTVATKSRRDTKAQEKFDKEAVIQSNMKAAEDRIDASLLRRALVALLKHEATKQDKAKQLFESDTPVLIQIGLLKAPAYSKTKPFRILLPHSIRTDENEPPEVCLIVKDSSKPWLQELIPRFPTHLGCVKKVLTLTSLRNKHHTFQQRRELAARFTHVLVDDRILPMLPSALGKDFLSKHKLVPISITRKEALPYTVQKAMQSTFLKLARGTCVTLPIGTSQHAEDELLENALAAISQAAACVPQQWKNIQSLCVKTHRSMALPFYNQLPEQLIDLSTLRSEDEIEAELMLSKVKERESKKSSSMKDRKRSLDKKSPLLRALKKQRTTETARDVGATAADTAMATQKKKKESKVHGKDKEAQQRAEASPSVSSKIESNSKGERSSQKKSKTSVSVKELDRADRSEDKKTHGEEKSRNTASGQKLQFIASAKYAGTKKGYVFKRDSKGVGYYVDKPPVVDTMALEAIYRMAKASKAGSSSGKNHRKGAGSKGNKIGRGRRH